MVIIIIPLDGWENQDSEGLMTCPRLYSSKLRLELGFLIMLTQLIKAFTEHWSSVRYWFVFILRFFTFTYFEIYNWHCTFFFFPFFLGWRLWCTTVPRLGFKLELQLPAYTTATAMPYLSHICKLHHNSWQCHILNPLSKARDSTCILMDASQICFPWATMGTPPKAFWLSYSQALLAFKTKCSGS